MGQEILLTTDGRVKIEEELSRLKGHRKEVAERIKVAREYGDLSENSEYEDAKNEQSFVEGKILELEEMLRRSRVVDRGGNDKVNLGSTVILKMDGETLTYTIVSSAESNPAEGKISSESPIGYSLMGKAKGEDVEITTPNGKMSCKIVDIQ